MPTHKSVREILETIIHERDKERDFAGKEWDMAQCNFFITQMCEQIADLLAGEKKEQIKEVNHANYDIYSEIEVWNACIDHLVKKIKEG